MIERMQLFPLNFYKKSDFYGSMGKMNYRIGKRTNQEQDEFEVVLWEGPYCFAKTAEEQKKKKTFPFTEDAMAEIVSYLNEQGKVYNIS